MLQTLKNAWNTKEIRSKILFTLFILLLYRIGTVIPVPFVEANQFASTFSGTILDYMNILSGGALGTATLFALGVSPYINASIIIQLLAVVFPKLGELAKTDKSKMNFITRITTVILAIVTAIGYYFLLKNSGALTNAATKGEGSVYWLYAIVIVACYCAGASVIMWLAERINERGIGNGISLILFANIISSIPSMAINLVSLVVDTYQYSEKAWLYGYFYWDWADASSQILKVEPRIRRIYTKHPSHYGVRKDAPIRFVNVLEELDSPGEYYIDREKMMLYI